MRIEPMPFIMGYSELGSSSIVLPLKMGPQELEFNSIHVLEEFFKVQEQLCDPGIGSSSNYVTP